MIASHGDAAPLPYQVAAIQFEPTLFAKDANLDALLRLTEEAAASGARLIVTPEMATTAYCWATREEVAADVEPIPGPTTERFAAKAREHGIYLLGGSIHEQSDTPGMYYNTSVMLYPAGEIIATYRKIHLFDIDLTGNVTANESSTILPGDEIVTADVDGHTVGLSI